MTSNNEIHKGTKVFNNCALDRECKLTVEKSEENHDTCAGAMKCKTKWCMSLITVVAF